MTSFSSDRGAELRELFFESAQELLRSLNDEALKLEKLPGDQEIVRSIRRVVHTLKGDAAACGFRDISETAHELEDALALEKVIPGTPLAELTFTAADTFGAMLASYRQNLSPPSPEPLRKMIRAMASQGDHERSVKTENAAVTGNLSEAEELAITQAMAQGKHVLRISARIDPLCGMPIAARQLVLNAVRGLGDVLAGQSDVVTASKQIDLLLASDRSADEVAARCRIPTVIADAKVTLAKRKARRTRRTPGLETPTHLDALPAPQAPIALAATGDSSDQPAGSAQSTTSMLENTLRVDSERVDNVLNLVGELIIGKSMLQQAINEFARRYPKEPLRGRFADAMAFQARVLNDLQRSVMTIRMVPVEQLFRRFPRIVRDVSRQCGKQAEVSISGQDTDLDKTLLDAIAEPLTHLVRNAVSHGIETAPARLLKGKPAEGRIRLNAYHQGNQVVVEVSDDGNGIDTQKVKTKALQQGLITQEEAGRLTDAELLRLTLRPGFSTADQITEISGRGVGLDVVQSVLQRLKGSVDIENRPGQGTTFRLKLPLTLAIIKALLFRVEHRLYAVPLSGVAEITRAHESDLHQIDHFEVLQIRDQPLSVVRLGRTNTKPGMPGTQKIFVLVMSLGDRRLGLIVDALEGEEELVIKALDDQSVATDLVSGASILGDGRVVLILNLAAIAERSSVSHGHQPGKACTGLLLSHEERTQLALSAGGAQS